MAQTIYKTVVTKLGESVNEFLEQGMLITFKDNAPETLAEYCILHSENDLMENIEVGDTLFIGHDSYRIIGVGEAVNKNLKALGHITFDFNGSEEVDLPGTLALENKAISQIKVGDVIKIER